MYSVMVCRNKLTARGMHMVDGLRVCARCYAGSDMGEKVGVQHKGGGDLYWVFCRWPFLARRWRHLRRPGRGRPRRQGRRR